MQTKASQDYELGVRDSGFGIRRWMDSGRVRSGVTSLSFCEVVKIGHSMVGIREE